LALTTGLGYSETCSGNAEGFCDSSYSPQSGLTDYLPLAKIESSSTTYYTNFDGSTTDFDSEVDITNVVQSIIEKVGKGKVKWEGTVNAENADFDSYVSFGDAWLSVDSANLNETFNSSANITFYNINSSDYYGGPVIFADGELCTDCTLIDYVGTDYSFNVQHFTNYTLVNGTYQVDDCGDIDVSGTYNLTTDIISNSGACLNITADDVALNFNGYKINNSNSATAIYSANVVNLTMNDVIINKLATGGYAIDFDNVTGVTNGLNITGTPLVNKQIRNSVYTINIYNDYGSLVNFNSISYNTYHIWRYFMTEKELRKMKLDEIGRQSNM